MLLRKILYENKKVRKKVFKELTESSDLIIENVRRSKKMLRNSFLRAKPMSIERQNYL